MNRLVAATVWSLAAALAACQPDPAGEPRETRWPVRLAVVARQPFQPTLLLLGVFQPAKAVILRVPADGVIHYPAPFAGRLAMGVEVSAGEVLATVTNASVDLGLTEAQLALDAAHADRQRTERAFTEGLVPRVDLDRVKTQEALAEARFRHASQQSAHLLVRAPIAGRLVVPASLPEGAQVAHDTELAEIVGRGVLLVAARAAPEEVAQLRPGLTALLSTAAGEDAGRATLREISPVLDLAGTAKVLATVDAMRREPLAGDGVQMIVELPPRLAVTVPEEAVVTSAAGQAVYTVDSAANPPRAHLRAVTLGGRAEGQVEVLAGLRPGERVVEHGGAALGEGAAVVEEPAAEVAGGRAATPPRGTS